MADAEQLLVSRIVYHAEMAEVVAGGIGSRHFHDIQHGEAWDWIEQFWEKYGKVPGRDAFRMQFPTYELKKVPEPLEFYVDKVRQAHHRFETLDMLAEATDLATEEKISESNALLADRLLVVAEETTVTDDEDFTQTWGERMALYAEIADHEGELVGIPTGFKTFDEITGGFQPEQFIVLIGPQKSGKSSIMLRSALAANDAGYKVLFIGYEMTNREQGARWDGLRSGINYTHMLHGKMTPREVTMLEQSGRKYEQNPAVHFVHDFSARTLAAMTAKFHQYRPDIVFVDGVYMMDSEIEGVESMDTRSLTKISRGLKRAAQTFKIPVVVSTQALDWKFNPKKGLQTSSAGYTSAFGQDCDFMFGVEPPTEEERAKMRLITGRTASKRLIILDFDWPNGRIEESEQQDWDEDGSGSGDDDWGLSAQTA